MSIKDIFTREDGALSEGRVTSVAACVLWTLVTIYLVLKNQTWGHYDGFSAVCFGYGVRQYFNKRTEVKAGMEDKKKAVSI